MTNQDKQLHRQALAAMRFPHSLVRWIWGRWRGFGFTGVHFKEQGLTLEFRRFGPVIRVKLYSKAQLEPRELNKALMDAQSVMMKHGRELQRRMELAQQIADGQHAATGTKPEKVAPEKVATPKPVRRADPQFWPKDNGHGPRNK